MNTAKHDLETLAASALVPGRVTRNQVQSGEWVVQALIPARSSLKVSVRYNWMRSIDGKWVNVKRDDVPADLA